MNTVLGNHSCNNSIFKSITRQFSDLITPLGMMVLFSTSAVGQIQGADADRLSLERSVLEILGDTVSTVDVVELGSGLVEIRGEFDDVSVVEARLSAAEVGRSLNLTRIILTNLKENRPDSSDGLVGIQWEEPAYLLGIDGSMYFPNSVLPTGEKLVSISQKAFSVEGERGNAISVDASHLQMIKPPLSLEQAAPTDPAVSALLAGNPVAIMAKQPPLAERYDHHILKAARRFEIDPSLIKAVIHTESRFDAAAVSVVGAQGLMQIMPDTGRELNLVDPFSPEQNIMAGTRLLRSLMDLYDEELDLALAAYNAGVGAVKKYRGVPPYKETLEYIEKVRNALYVYQDFGAELLSGHNE